MEIDFSAYFKRYESLVESVEKAFVKVKEQYPEEVKCKEGCSDCCHAVFDLSLVEAIYLKHHFDKKYSGKEKHELIEKASKADRELYRLKRAAYKEFEKGNKTEIQILGEMAMKRVRCPLLNEDNCCDLYENRPLTCRIYGIPTSTEGIGHSCGLSGFQEKGEYPTLNMDIVHQKMYEMAHDLVVELQTTMAKMADMLIPVSMAMMTDFTPEYLGIGQESDEGEKNATIS